MNQQISLEKLFKEPYELKSNTVRENLEQQVFRQAKNFLLQNLEVTAEGVLDLIGTSFAFIRFFETNFKNTICDILISRNMIVKYELQTGDLIYCKLNNEIKGKYFQAASILKINTVEIKDRKRFSSFYDRKSFFPHQQVKLSDSCPSDINRILDLLVPIGYGQRAIIASPPKCGKTDIIANIAKGSQDNFDEIVILMIAERPEETTDLTEHLDSKVKIISSNFDEEPSRHVKVSKLIVQYVIKQVEERKVNVMLLIDSLTRFVRSANYLNSGGKILTGGLDVNSLLNIKPILGAARNFKDEGSLTIIGTMLIDTGSKMDDIIFDECKGTSNMDISLSKELSNKGFFPSIDLLNSSTRKSDLMMSPKEFSIFSTLRKLLLSMSREEAMLRMKSFLKNTKDNKDLIVNLSQSELKKNS